MLDLQWIAARRGKARRWDHMATSQLVVSLTGEIHAFTVHLNLLSIRGEAEPLRAGFPRHGALHAREGPDVSAFS